MREAHAHLAALGESLSMPTLEGCRSLAECLNRIRTAAAASVPASFLRLHSARIESWPEARWPTLTELDAASPSNPCVLMSFDHHAAAANTAALSAANITPDRRIEPNGVVVVDNLAGGGSPTGLLLEGAAYAAWKAAPEPTPAQRTAHLSAALAHLAALGFTEAHDLNSQPWLGPALAALERTDNLPLCIHLYPPAARLEADFAARSQWESTRLRLAGGKVFADGTLNSRTAAMLVNYRQPMPGLPRGQLMVDPASFRTDLATAQRLGLHLAIHAIGDAAVRFALDAITDVARSSRPASTAHRIEHCELIDPADIPRFAALGVTCSPQPCHLLSDIEALNRYLPHRLDRVLPLRELIDSGLTPGRGLIFGSDVPIVRANPADSIHAAIHRRRADMPPSAAIAPHQHITESEARACFAAS